MKRVTWESICAEIEAEPKLSALEERALWQAWQDGDDRCRTKLISCTMRYALGHAKKLAKPGQRWEPGDLLGEAVQAIDGCLTRWDGSGSFAGYASARIRGTMQDYLRRRADVLRTPAGAERVLSLDAPDDGEGDGLLERHGAFAVDIPDLPTLTKSEMEILKLTVLATPPRPPEDAAKALGLAVKTVDRRLRSALRKSAAT